MDKEETRSGRWEVDVSLIASSWSWHSSVLPVRVYWRRRCMDGDKLDSPTVERALLLPLWWTHPPQQRMVCWDLDG